MLSFKEEKQEQKLAQIKAKEEEDTAKILAQKYGIPYLDVSHIPINTDALKILDESEARLGHLAIIQKTGKKLQIILKNPERPETKTALDHLQRLNYSMQLFFTSERGLEHAWELYKHIRNETGVSAGEINITPEGLASFQQKINAITDITPLVEEALTKRITDFLEIIIAGALQLDASDIHVEPQAENIRIRYRLDGVLEDVAAIPEKAFKFLLSRIKLISGLKLNVTERAQDGRFTIKLPDVDIEVRVSILPGPYGENIVLRILNPKSIDLKIEDLGMQPEIAEEIRQQLKQPNGMILTTGPTGSGKTTALYTFLKTIHSPEIKIITLEDPIEYHLPGIEQTQVSSEKNYTFASGLRSVLRQDPDVILVGEIRDLETAETAMHAALTGHLVFSTLHTNDAAGTIPRLIDIGVKPNIIAPAMNLAIAQRLLRKLCAFCKKEDAFSKEETLTIKKELDSFPPHAKVKKPSVDFSKIKTHRPLGCLKCNMSGYKSRVGVFEIIIIDEIFEDIILKLPSEQDIKKAAFAQGQITMKQDATLKVLMGITDLAEVERILG